MSISYIINKIVFLLDFGVFSEGLWFSFGVALGVFGSALGWLWVSLVQL